MKDDLERVHLQSRPVDNDIGHERVLGPRRHTPSVPGVGQRELAGGSLDGPFLRNGLGIRRPSAGAGSEAGERLPVFEVGLDRSGLITQLVVDLADELIAHREIGDEHGDRHRDRHGRRRHETDALLQGHGPAA